MYDVEASDRVIFREIIVAGLVFLSLYNSSSLFIKKWEKGPKTVNYTGKSPRRLEAYEQRCHEADQTPAHISLAWLLQQLAVTAPIIGPRTLDQLTGTMRGSVANSIFNGIEGFNLHNLQIGIANFIGVF